MSAPSFTTAEDLYSMGADARFELIAGELIEYPLHGGLHGAACAKLAWQVGAYARSTRLGELLIGQVGCVLQRNPDTVLAPDLVFIRSDRLKNELDDGFLVLAPDLVAEILEPWESEGEIQRKLRIYLDAGVAQIWVVDPSRREMRIQVVDQPATVFSENDIVTASDVLPGFKMRVGDLFEWPIPDYPQRLSLSDFASVARSL